MDALIIMLKNVAVFVLLALPGYILVKTGRLKDSASGVLSTVLIYVGVPFLIMSGTMNNIKFDRELIAAILLAALISAAFSVFMFFASKPLTAFERESKTRGMMRFAATSSNNGFLGIPLAVAVFGEASAVLTVVIVVNIITNVYLFTLGIYLISGDKSTISAKKALLNPVLIAFVIGIILNLLKVPEHIPEINSYSSHLSGLVTPLSMTVLGMKMGGVRILSIFRSKRLYYTAFLKLIAFPVTVTALLMLASRLGASAVDSSLITGIFVSFAVPTASLATTFSDSYNGDTENAVAFTLGTTVMSVLTLPVLYWALELII